MFPRNTTTGSDHWNDVFTGKSQPAPAAKSVKSSAKTAAPATTTSAAKKPAVEKKSKVEEKSSAQKTSVAITKADLERIPESINFPNEEEKVLQYWKDEQVFENCLKQSKGKPR